MEINQNKPIIGLYEKALPANLSWFERLALAKKLGFDYVEMSIDETAERQSRLQWDNAQKMAFIQAKLETKMDVPSLCLSVHRAYPLGSNDPKIRQKSRILMQEAINLAKSLGIRNIQLAGYDVYYEPSDVKTKAFFIEGMQWAAAQAAAHQVMISVEIMDTVLMSSISKWCVLEEKIGANPWFSVYPDVGNLSAWQNEVASELKKGIHKISAIHLKDTQAITPTQLGQFREVVFGEGCVDFKAIFSTLSELKYQGSFLIEMWAKNDGADLAHIAKAKQWLIEQMEEAKNVDQ